MKFQDDISNMNTHTHTRTSRNQYVPHFFKVGGITSDTTPFDFTLFPKLKRELKGKHFNDLH